MKHFLSVKKLKCFVIAIFIFSTMNTVAAKKPLEVCDAYSRNSISFVVVTHGDSYYDKLVLDAVQSYTNEKFDYNDISIKTISIPHNRLINPKIKSLKKVDSPYSIKEVGKVASAQDFGRQIFSYWTMREQDGSMSEKRILDRGKYNATQEDLNDANASKVGPEWIAENGYNLIRSSYVVVIDCYAIGNYLIDGNVEPAASINAIIYKLDMDEGDINNVLEKTWITDNDTPKQIEKKIKAYNKTTFSMKERLCVEKITHSISISIGKEQTQEEKLTQCIEDCLNDVMDHNKMSEWKVSTPIIHFAPMQANIGKKEGLKNGHRYLIYKYKEKKDGTVVPVKVGYARAVNKIPDNRMVVNDSVYAKEAKFYQLSGTQVVEGMMISESKDKKMQFNWGLGMIPGAGKLGLGLAVDLGLNYNIFMHTSKRGLWAFSHYAMLDANFGQSNRMSLRYGFGMRCIRVVEMVPYIGFMYNIEDSEAGFCGGAIFNLRLLYPTDLYLKIGGGAGEMQIGLGFRHSF